MGFWEKTLMAVTLVVMLVFLAPHAKAMMEESRKAENPDWKGALIPIGMVILFVMFLISMVRG
jgi:hypothetical protein